MAAIDPERLRSARVETRQHYDARDSILYALGLGVGAGGMAIDRHTLRYVYERQLEAIPTMATALAYPGMWYASPEFGLDARRIVNAEQSLELHAPLPVAADVTSLLEVEAIIDKGAGRGALLHTVRHLHDTVSGRLIATVRQAYFCIGQGGFGGADDAPPTPASALPDRPADRSTRIAVREDAALLYRLSGDLNPIHIDPAAAAEAGFSRPLLHGLATFGMAGYALLRDRPGAFTTISARYSAPVFPGDILCCDIWDVGHDRAFRVSCQANGRIVLDRGRSNGAS